MTEKCRTKNEEKSEMRNITHSQNRHAQGFWIARLRDPEIFCMTILSLMLSVCYRDKSNGIVK